MISDSLLITILSNYVKAEMKHSRGPFTMEFDACDADDDVWFTVTKTFYPEQSASEIAGLMASAFHEIDKEGLWVYPNTEAEYL